MQGGYPGVFKNYKNSMKLQEFNEITKKGKCELPKKEIMNYQKRK
jgi:ribosomal protein S2